MAKDTNIGIKISADVVDLKSGIKGIKDEISRADKDFNKATAGLDKWSTSSEGLGAKITQLNTKLNSQKKSVELYQAEIERVSKLEGDHSAELENLKEKLESAEISVKKTEKQIRHYSKSLEDVINNEKEQDTILSQLTKTISEQENSLSDLQNEYKDAVLTYGKNSKEAKALKKEINNLSGELEDNKQQVKYADKQLELLDKQFDDTSDSAESFAKGLDGIKGIGATVGKGLATIGASVTALATGFLATASETKEFRTNMGKLESGFETSGLKAEQATETYKKLFSVVADEGKATEATAMLGQLAQSQEELNKWVNISTGVYATFGDSLPIENLAEASLETSKTGKITGGLADALNWAGISEEKFQESLDKCTTEQERQKLITDTLNKTYDEASKKYQEVNKDVIESNKSQVELSETMAQLGEKAEPILTAVKDGFNEIMKAVLGLVENVDFDAIKESIENAFAYFIDTIIPAIIDGFNWIVENKDMLITGIVAIGTAMLAWNVVSIIQGVVGAIKAWTVATEGMTIAQKLLNLAMKANPIGIVISLVAGLVAGFVMLWNKSDAFREFWINLWEKIKVACSVAWENIKKVWGVVADWFGNVFKAIVNWFKGVPDSLSKFFSNAWSKIKSAWSGVGKFFSDIISTITNTFKELPSKMLSIGEDLVKGLWNGIKDMTKWITGKLKQFTGDVLGGIKKFFGIHSPSKEMAKIGKYLDEGLAQGIEKNKTVVTKATDELGKELLGSLSGIEKQIENKKLAEKLVALGGKTENPFKGWTHAQLNEESVQLESSLANINKQIIDNGVVQEQWGTSSDKMIERAKLLEERYKIQLQLLDIYNQKLKYYESSGVETPEWVTNNLETLKSGLETTLNEYDELNNAIDSKTEKTTKSFVDKFEDALGLSEEKMSEWKDKVGNDLEKIAGYVESGFGSMSELGSNIMNLYNQTIDNEIQKLDEELAKYNEVKDAELEKAKEVHNEELTELETALRNGSISEKTYNLKKAQMSEELAETQKKLEEEKRLQEQETLKKKNELAKKQFNAQKINDIAQATIQGALAIVKGFAQLGPIGGAINAGIQAGITAVQIGTIASQKFVPMLAKGGIVDNPTLAMVGEAGKEAVIPLENNTGWIRELAEKLNEVMRKDFSFGINATQLQPALAGATTVNNYYYQTINSPQQLSRKEIYRDTKNLLSLRG